MARKKQVSAKTRVKLSQAAKRRQRGAKGTRHAGHFMAGMGAPTGGKDPSRPMKAWDFKDPPNPNQKRHGSGHGANQNSPHDTAGTIREKFMDERGRVATRQYTDDQIARHIVRSKAAGDTGVSVTPADTYVGEVKRVGGSDVRSAAKLRREASWQTQGGLYTNDAAIRRGRYMPPRQFMEREMPESHRRWIDEQLADPNSEFSRGLRTDPYTGEVRNLTAGRLAPGQRNRVEIYTRALQEGASHTEALARLQGERRGRSAGGTTRSSRTEARAVAALEKTPSGRRGKYDALAPRESEFSVGLTAQNVQTIGELAKRYPNAGDRELIKMQQFQRMHLADELTKNQAWAHETRQANITRTASNQGPDRVVFFTTNMGSPAPSVPADSLVGQYIIRKRVKAARKMNLASERDLRGRFPEAVRDMHIVEASTGLALGAEGRWGAFQKSGWRAGTRRSRNYGKPVPLGQQVLTDSQGRPMYDESGNIRWTEGATRPFKFETMKDAGFRVFIG